MVNQIVQVVGSFAILVAFFLAQRKKLSTDSRPYLMLNTVGSVILGVIAIIEVQFGFIILEVAWTAVSGWGLWRTYQRAGGRLPAGSLNTVRTACVSPDQEAPRALVTWRPRR
jgi:hypothetical protein